MNIETLPLLSSEFPTWTWWGSNGEASESAVNLSYLALENKDLCSKFIREVWNDLVKLLNNALTTAGFQWNSTYGDLDSTLFDTSLRINREFKASMFNAVVLNINQLGIFHWNWERTNNMPGFLGRTYMRGYSEYGNSSDFIYGWYILEIAEKLNVLLNVLKNEGPFGEYEGLISVASYAPAEVYSTQSGILVYQDKSEIIIDSSLASAYAVGTKSQEKASSYVAGNLINGLPKKINTSIGAYTDVDAKVTLAKRQDISGHGLGETFSGSELTGMIFVQRLLYSSEMQAKYTTGFAVPYSPKLKFAEGISSHESAKIVCVPRISWLETEENRKSYSVADLMLSESVIMSAIPESNSFSISEMILRDKLLMDSIRRSKSYVESSMDYKRAQYMRRLIESFSYQNSGIDTKISVPMKKSEAVWSYYEATAVARAVETLEKILESTTEYIGKVSPVLSNPLNVPGKQEKTYANGFVKSIQGEFVATQIKSDSYTDSRIMDGIPKLMEGNVHVQEYDISELQTSPCEVVEFKGDSHTLYEAKFAKGLPEKLKGKYKSSTAVVCALEFESTKETWYDPVQNGTDLYIRNVYVQHEEDENVHIGHKFFDAEQSGSNLYIRSTYAQNQNQSDVNVGLVYHEPEQTETNVYIRSAESLKGV
ncbi:MAG: hypothetical protein J6B94_08655 [Lachnospiraceae bacterium]|nr:hypothetical protein [Lachnospiraceae bacterium]